MIKAILIDLESLIHKSPECEACTNLTQGLAQQLSITDINDLLYSLVTFRSDAADKVPITIAARLQQAIAQHSGHSQAVVSRHLQHFFRSVAEAHKPDEITSHIVQCATDAGYRVIFLGPPLLPESEVNRLIPSVNAELDYVSHSENSHFSPADPARYAEIVARVSVEPDEALMLSRSNATLASAEQIGCHCYRLDEQQSSTQSLGGSLEQFCQAIRSDEFKLLESSPLRPDMVIPQYRGNIAALYGMLDNIKPAYWTQHPDPDEWSIIQILCHLAQSEDETQRPRLERILTEDNPFIVPPRPPGPNIADCDNDGYRIAERFVTTRQQTITLLESLRAEDWYRPARHSIFGLTTLLEMAHFTAQHDRLHLNQLCQTIGKCT